MALHRYAVVLIVVVAALVAAFFKLFVKPDRLVHNRSYKLKDDDWQNVLDKTRFDFIIVGSGSAGSVLANRLTINRTEPFNVLLLEAGGADTALEHSLPAAFMKLFRTDADWNFDTVPQKKAHNRNFYWPRGKVLGGSSNLNAMIYQRGNKQDYDGWAKSFGDESTLNPVTNKPHWSYDDVLHYFKKSERQQSREMVDPAYHGFDGEWYVTENKWVHKMTKDFVQAFHTALKLPVNHDTNGKDQLGVGFNQVNIYLGRRHSASDAFLSNEVLARPNLFVRTRAHVTKLIFSDDGKQVVGVEYVDTISKRTFQVRATKEVILSAGAVQSPQILMLSGIGPKKELERHNIPVRMDLPVGENLLDHIASGIYINVSCPSLHQDDNLKSLFQWILFGSGPFASNGADLNGFYLSEIAKKAGETAPDMQIVGMAAFYIDHGFGKLPYSDGYSLGVVLLQPKSSGNLTLKSADPFDKPIIDPNYFHDPSDLQRIVESVRIYRKVLATPPVKDFVISEVLPGSHARTDEEIAKALLENCFSLYHPVGTCKMGRKSDSKTVVDQNLKVKGIKGLRVVDASIMPYIIRANTNAPTIMISEKASDLILNEYTK
jgi:choline dehydrogenase